MPGPNNPDIEVTAPFIRLRKPDGTWTSYVDANLVKVITPGDINTPTEISVESAAHGAKVEFVNIDVDDIMSAINTARK